MCAVTLTRELNRLRSGNAKGVMASSPGLRLCATLGTPRAESPTPKRVARSDLLSAFCRNRVAVRAICRFFPGLAAEPANPGLEVIIPSG